jgi:hypothetical protein
MGLVKLMAPGTVGMLFTTTDLAIDDAEVPQVLFAFTVMSPDVAVEEKLTVVELPVPAKVAPVPLYDHV